MLHIQQVQKCIVLCCSGTMLRMVRRFVFRLLYYAAYRTTLTARETPPINGLRTKD
jgi:hypothetical protein